MLFNSFRCKYYKYDVLGLCILLLKREITIFCILFSSVIFSLLPGLCFYGIRAEKHISVEEEMTTPRVRDINGSDVSSENTRPTTIITPMALSENSLSLKITSFKLNGKNFLSWSRSIQLVIRGKEKFGYLDGSLKQPESTYPSFSTWDINNYMVMSWLINSMENSIAEIYLLNPTAKAIWDVV